MEKAMAPHSSTLAWQIPWMEEPGRLQSMGSLGVRHDWPTSFWLFTFMHWRRKWLGEAQGRGSLVGCRLWGCTESGTTEETYQQQWSLRKTFYVSLLFFETLHSNWYIFPFLLCFSLLFYSQVFVRLPQTAIFPFCISFSWWWSWLLLPVQCHKPPSIVLQALYQI